MANELFFAGNPDNESGLTVTADVYDRAGTLVSSGISCSEVGTTAIYLGDMPASGPGSYLVRYFDGGSFRAQGELMWDGERVVTGNPAVDISEGAETILEALRLIRAEAAGKLLVSGNLVRIRDAADTRDRITATVDTNGQRYTVITDAG